MGRATPSWGQGPTTPPHTCPQGCGMARASSWRRPQGAAADIIIVCVHRGLFRGVSGGSRGIWRGVDPTLGTAQKGARGQHRRVHGGRGPRVPPDRPHLGSGCSTHGSAAGSLPTPTAKPCHGVPLQRGQGSCEPSYLWGGHRSTSSVPLPRRCPQCWERGAPVAHPGHRRSHPGFRARAGQEGLGQAQGSMAVTQWPWQGSGCAILSGLATGDVLVALGSRRERRCFAAR